MSIPVSIDTTPQSKPIATRYGISFDALSERITKLGEKPFRTKQVWEGLYAQYRPLEAITNVSATLREQLAADLPFALTEVVRREGDNGRTVKWLWRAFDGAQVETVLMRYRDRATVCVSSQAGCAMACSFCATGQAGFERHLDVGEIVEQVLRAQHDSEQRVSNVVFMGMGEPLANLDNVWAATERLHADLGLSARHITISTVGIVPGMRKLADLPLPVTLAVSLHAPDDELRNELVPVNKRYPIAAVVDAAREYVERKGRRVTFEYACIERVNDQILRAEALAQLLRRFPGGAHVNLIPLNATDGYGGDPASALRIENFAAVLTEKGVNATIRRNRGTDIDAACGQLRSRNL